MRGRISFHVNMKKAKYVKLLPIILALVMLVCSCSVGNQPGATIPDSVPAAASPDSPVQQPSSAPHSEVTEPSQTAQQKETTEPTQPILQIEKSEPGQSTPLEDSLQVYFLDVGQADCILVKTGQHSMLIDSGDTEQGRLILGYLSDRGISTLDYLVATHPHSDHIGSMPDIIRAMESIGSLLMPDIVHTTKTFEDLLDAIEDTDTSVIVPQPGEIFEMGDARIQILAPNNSTYNDLNNYSIVLRVDFGQSSFLFTGDAEDVSESEQLANAYVLQTDVIKIGHHGSDSSSTQKYIESVSPSHAVISCGKGNSYGHPHSETIARLSAMGVTVYRTDENGTITFTTDGHTIEAVIERDAGTETVNPSAAENTEPNTTQYIGNKNSKIFHKSTCSTLPAEKNRIYFSNRDEAINRQYRACQRCNP